MGYLALSSWPIEHEMADLASVAKIATPADAGRFSPLELHVIALAEREDVTREPKISLLGRLLRLAFGLDPRRPLANLRLEQLRRFASLAYHHPDEVTEADIQEVVEAGYSLGQARGLVAWMSRHRSAGPGWPIEGPNAAI